MRIVTNEQRLKRSRQLSQVLFFASLIILFGGLILNSALATSTLFIFVPCIIMPLGLVTTIYSVRLTNHYVRLPHPEDAIRDGLKGVNRRSVLFNYLQPANHILVSPQGVFVLTQRYQITRFTVEGDKFTDRRQRGLIGRLFLFLRQEGIGDPFKDAEKEATAVQTQIDAFMPEAKIPVQPVVVLISNKAELVSTNPKYPVVFADNKKKPSLKSLLRGEKRKNTEGDLTDAEIEAITAKFLEALPESQRSSQVDEEGDTQS